jgi:hypothetical protein
MGVKEAIEAATERAINNDQVGSNQSPNQTISQIKGH